MHEKHMQFYHVVRPSLKCLPTPRCGVPTDKGCNKPSQMIQRSNLSATILPYIMNPSRKESPQIGVSCSRTARGQGLIFREVQ
jgi:hypothetical protein